MSSSSTEVQSQLQSFLCDTSLGLAYHWNVDRPQFTTQLGIDLQKEKGIQQDTYIHKPHPTPPHLALPHSTPPYPIPTLPPLPPPPPLPNPAHQPAALSSE